MNKRKKYRLLIVCATMGELSVAKEIYSHIKPDIVQADFLCSGMGNLSMAMTLTHSLSQTHYDFVLHYGVCGYKETSQKLIQIVRSVYVPTEKEILVPVFFEFAPLASIACSESPVFDTHILGKEDFVDMESYACEKVCEFFKIPRLILKVPVDKVGQETRDFDIERAKIMLKAQIDWELLFTNIGSYISQLPQKIDLSIYQHHYHLTVSEKILLEKYIAKYESLTQKDFSSFFAQHKTLEKKDFFTTVSKKLDSLSRLG